MVVAALYVTTLAQTVGWTDTGELMAVAQTLGTAHPTGYPLMTLIARTWLLVPTGLRVALHLNLLSAFLVAAASGVFFVFFSTAFAEVRSGRHHRHNWPSAAAVAGLATSTTYWIQASSYEVYALHLLLMACILACYGQAIEEQAQRPVVMSRWWIVFAWCVGLSFANHMTTILLAPALLWDYVRRYGWQGDSRIRIGRMAVAAISGLSVYAVLPIRAASWPPLNWGDPSTWENFIRHVSGAQYRIWMFSGGDVMSRQWRGFVDGLPLEFIWPWLGIAFWGWIVSWRRWRRQAEFVGLLVLAGILYAVNYDIHEIGPYFLVVYVAIALAVVPGIVDLQERISRWHARGSIVLPVFMSVCIVWQATAHHPRISGANTPAVEQFARTVLDEVEPGAVVLTGRWDYLYSPSLYLQTVEHVRPDVLVIDHSLLRDRSWYVESLRRRAPWLERALSQEFEGFVRELRKFERGEPFVPAIIQMRWNALLSGIIRVASAIRPVYFDVRLAAEIRPGNVVPSGYVLRLGSGELQKTSTLPVWIPANGNESAYLADFRAYLASAFLEHAWMARASGSDGIADSLVGLARLYSPTHPGLANFSLPSKKLGD